MAILCRQLMPVNTKSKSPFKLLQQTPLFRSLIIMNYIFNYVSFSFYTFRIFSTALLFSIKLMFKLTGRERKDNFV